MSFSRLLVADVDGTLLGDTDALARLATRLRTGGIALVLNSSRPIDSVRASGGISVLPIAGIIGALGTQIELSGAPDRQWQARFDDFPRDRLSTLLAALGPAHRAELQAPAKVSHAVPRALWSHAARLVHDLDPRLRVVTSGESNFDVVPHAAGKANAARYVAAQSRVPWARVVTAGDDEIDAELLVAAKGIVVGNATPALRRLLAGRAYQATACYAAGVIEGLAHYEALEEAAEHG